MDSEISNIIEYIIKWFSVIVSAITTLLFYLWYRKEKKYEPLIGVLAGLGAFVVALWTPFKKDSEPDKPFIVPSDKIKIELTQALREVQQDIEKTIFVSMVSKSSNSKPSEKIDAVPSKKNIGYVSTMSLKEGDIHEDFRTRIKVQIFDINVKSNTVSYQFIFPNEFVNKGILASPNGGNAGIIHANEETYEFEFSNLQTIGVKPFVDFSIHLKN